MKEEEKVTLEGLSLVTEVEKRREKKRQGVGEIVKGVEGRILK